MEHCPGCGTELESRERDGRNRDYCPACDRILYRNPKPVAWLLLEHSGRYLLIKRGHEPDKGEWDIPGGFVELEESFPEAARRELREETGASYEEDIRLLGTLEFHRVDEDVVGVVFHAELDEKPETRPGEEAMEARFWDMEELESSDEKLRSLCREVLERCSATD